ncbi:MAG: hypothetical protein ABGX68_04015 [Methylococcales bacterium]|jgi:uncharacterized membrane protein YvbJ|nr:hypothetical protein [Methylococcaceae bacterium]
MPQCNFCGTKEEKDAPLCHSCGAIRYPVDKKKPSAFSSQNKLKLSVALAAVIVTPGSLLLLAIAGAAHLKRK